MWHVTCVMRRSSDIFIYFLSKKAHKTKMNIASRFIKNLLHIMVEGKHLAQSPLSSKDSRRTEVWLVIFVILLWRNPTIWLWEEQIWFNTDSCHAIQVAGIIEMLIYINKLLFIVYLCCYSRKYFLLKKKLLFNAEICPFWKCDGKCVLLNNAEKLDRIYLDRKPQIEHSQVNSFKSAFNFDISLVRSLQKSVSL